MSDGYEVAHIDELEELPINNGEFVWRPIRRRFGITAFGTNAYTGDAGQRVIEQEGYPGYRLKRRRYLFTGKWKLDPKDENRPRPEGLIGKKEWDLSYPATTAHAGAPACPQNRTICTWKPCGMSYL